MAELYSVREVASQLHVNETTVRRWILSGALPAVILPRTGGAERNFYRISRHALENLLRETTITPEEDQSITA